MIFLFKNKLNHLQHIILFKDLNNFKKNKIKMYLFFKSNKYLNNFKKHYEKFCKNNHLFISGNNMLFSKR